MITEASRLREHRIVQTPISRHSPGLHAIEMNGAGGLVRLGDAPVFIQLRPRRLNDTFFILATRLDHRLLSVPSPVEIKPGVRLGKHRRLKLRFLPALAAVGGYIDLGDLAATGPGQAGNLDISRAWYFHSGRRPRN